MSKKVDERVVSMEFDNKNFENNVKTSVSTLDKLKKALKLDGAVKGLETIDSTAKKMNFSGMSDAIDTVNAKFSALQVVGMTALSNITNSAVNAGKRIISALTIDPIISGFQEYETQINAVQTILANTQSKGSTLTDVNRALDELNKYADQTIYNFTEMTKNIGTFTAAGVDLDKSVTSIKGIANLAAVSGSTSLQASTAMYQLSQALAAGKVQLMDWNSVVNAGMGGELFQNALKRTATQMGTNVDALIEKYGSFRESLTKGEWLTAEVLTETLTQLSGAYTEADLIAQGYTESQAKEIVKLAETAVNAATKVKTFTQLFDTLGEALQSGWTQSWEIILGDFNEAQEMFTEISNTLGDIINASAESRNNLLMGGLASGWKQLLDRGVNDEQGFVESVKTVAKEHGVAVDKMMEDGTTFEQTLKKGWLTSDMLTESVTKYVDQVSKMSAEERKAAGYTADNVEELKKFAEELKTNSSLAEEFTNKMKQASGRENLIQGLWNIFNSLMSIAGVVKDAFRDIFPQMTGDQLYDLTVKFEKFTESLKPSTEMLDRIKRIATGVFSAFQLIGKGIYALISPIGQLLGSSGMGDLVTLLLDGAAAIGDFFTALNKSTDSQGFFTTISETLGSGVKLLSNLISSATAGVRNFGDIFTFVGDTIANVAQTIWSALKNVFEWIQENIGLGDIFNGIMAGTGIIGVKQMADLLKQFKDFFGGGIMGMIFGTGDDDDEGGLGALDQIKEKFVDILDSVHGALESFTVGIKATTLLEIAGALWLLSDSLERISQIDSDSMVQGLIGMGAMFTMLNFAFRGITKSLSMFESGGIVKAGVALIAMAYAMDKFADALVKVSELNLDDIGNGLVALGGGLAELIAGLKFLDGKSISLKTSIAIVALAYAADMLADALTDFSKLSWDEIGRGLTAMGGALAELSISLGALSKIGGGGSILGAAGIWIAVQSLDEISENLKRLGSMSWEQIKKGLSAMGGALGELTVALGILSKVGGFGSILGSVGILIAVQSLDEISENLKRLGSMSWEQVKKGLTAMGGALGELAIALVVLSKLGGFGSILGAVGILIAVQSLDEISENLKRLGSLSWDEIKRGLTAMGGALAELGIVSGALGKLAGISGIIGAGTILIVVQSLEPIADTLERLGKLSWEEIGRGLTAMGGALLELAVIPGALGKIAGLSGIIGAGTILIAVQSLEPIADALERLGKLSWEEIGRGLTAMGGALAELGAASFLTGLGGLASLAGAGSLTLAAQSLGDLANAFEKFGKMSWDEIERGLTAMGTALGETALGGLLNTFSGFGAGAIATMAEPLGNLADSVKKWAGVQVPEGLGDQLGQLAGGVGAFWNSGWGADAISTVAEPLGVMADSVKKWSSVVIPEGLGDQIGSLAGGIGAFWNSGWGADAIATVAGPLGTLADSVSKWSAITVPENMQENLEGLAKGVGAFNFSFGFSLDSFVDPLSRMADSVAKWSGITVPANMEETLTGLANGVKAFNWSWGNSLESFIDPLSDLGDILPKYSGIYLQSSIGENIKSLGEGVKSLAGKSPGDISGVVTAIGDLVDVAKTISGANLSGAAQQLASFATAINNVNVSADNFSNLGTSIVDSFVNAILSGQSRVQSAVTSLATIAVSSFTTAISGASTVSSSAGLSLISGLISGLMSGVGKLNSTVQLLITATANTIEAKQVLFKNAGNTLVARMSDGMSSYKYRVIAAIQTVLSSSSSTIRSYYGKFYTSGAYLCQGLANGISANSYMVRARASAMASAAALAAQRALDERSPSKVFYKIGAYAGQGLVNALGDYEPISYKAGRTIAESAVDGVGRAITSISDVLNSEMDVQPTIRPVIDLTDVRNGANQINGLFNEVAPLYSIGIAGSINRSMNSKIQNGTFNDVVDAVNKLRMGLDDIGKPSYTIGGITYESGSDVATAIEQLARAIKVERRL